MKTAILIARILLGLIFLVFGLNGFLHFIPMPMPTGLAGQYFSVLSVSHYMVPVFLLQIAGAVLLLANRFIPLALTLLGPVLANILLFHLLIAPSGLPLALVTAVLWSTVFYRERQAFQPLFIQRSVHESRSSRTFQETLSRPRVPQGRDAADRGSAPPVGN
jgi:hypothetical protein